MALRRLSDALEPRPDRGSTKCSGMDAQRSTSTRCSSNGGSAAAAVISCVYQRSFDPTCSSMRELYTAERWARATNAHRAVQRDHERSNPLDSEAKLQILRAKHVAELPFKTAFARLRCKKSYTARMSSTAVTASRAFLRSSSTAYTSTSASRQLRRALGPRDERSLQKATALSVSPASTAFRHGLPSGGAGAARVHDIGGGGVPPPPPHPPPPWAERSEPYNDTDGGPAER